MAEFKIGDRVNFLNNVGGGKVTKIIDSRMVMVEVEDGFEIPTLISEIVPDFRNQPSRQQQIVDTVQKEIKEKEIVQQQQQEDARHGALRRFAKEAETTADKLAALFKKAIPDYLMGEWVYANALANAPVLDAVVECLIEKGLLVPPENWIGAEGCYMFVQK